MNHLAFIIPGIDKIGGAERQTILLAKGIAQRPWRVTVVALTGTGGDAAQELNSAGVEYLSLGMRKGLADPRGWLRFRNWMRREAPDLVHAHLPHAAWFARWSRLGSPMRALVDTLHSSSTGTAGRTWGYRASQWLPDLVTAVSQSVAEAHLNARMVDEKRLTLVPNGVDVQAWKPDADVRKAMRAEHGLEGKFLWLAAGRLDPVKDYPRLLRAFGQTLQNAILVIAGDGPLRGELEQLTAIMGLRRRVRFLGFEPNLLRWMQAADGFVLASLHEGLPMGLLEAGACALPSVATDVAGSNEVIVPGETGWLSPAGSATALGECMFHVMNATQEERCKTGAQARRRVCAKFSLTAVLDQWEGIYTELLAQNQKPKRWA